MPPISACMLRKAKACIQKALMAAHGRIQYVHIGIKTVILHRAHALRSEIIIGFIFKLVALNKTLNDKYRKKMEYFRRRKSLLYKKQSVQNGLFCESLPFSCFICPLFRRVLNTLTEPQEHSSHGWKWTHCCRFFSSFVGLVYFSYIRAIFGDKIHYYMFRGLCDWWHHLSQYHVKWSNEN